MGLIFRFFTVPTSSCGGKARVTEIPEGAKPPRPPPGGKARVTEIPEGGFAPHRPPHYNILKKEDFDVDGRRRNVQPKNFWAEKKFS